MGGGGEAFSGPGTALGRRSFTGSITAVIEPDPSDIAM
jgi:hypothetical protein